MTILVDATGSASADTTRPLTRKGTGSKISDYFKRRAANCTTYLVREDSALSASSLVTSRSLSLGERSATNSVGNVSWCEYDKAAPNSDHEPIEHKITPGNGWQVARRLQISKKRVKREIIFDDEEIDRVSQRHGPRAKLGLLPSLPLDTLFEVCFCFCVVYLCELIHQPT